MLPKPYEEEIGVMKRAKNRHEAEKELRRLGLKSLKEVLTYFYYGKGLSSRDIAAIISKSDYTARSWLVKSAIKLMPAHRPADVWEVSERKERLGLRYVKERDVTARLNYWVPAENDPYLLGALFGDGAGYAYIHSITGSVEYKVEFGNGCKELIKVVEKLMKRHGTPERRYFYDWVEDGVLHRKQLKTEEREKANYWTLRMTNKKLFDALHVKRRKKNLKTLDVILKRKEWAKGFIQGYGDADGSPVPDKRRIEFFSTCYPLLSRVKKALKTHFGIAGTTKETEWNTVLHHEKVIYQGRVSGVRLFIYGIKNLQRYWEEIGFKHPSKRERLAKMARISA